MNKIWIAMAVDCGDTCDGKPRVLGAYGTRDEALEVVKADMRAFEVRGVAVDYARLGCDECEWSVDSVDLP